MFLPLGEGMRVSTIQKLAFPKKYTNNTSNVKIYNRGHKNYIANLSKYLNTMLLKTSINGILASPLLAMVLSECCQMFRFLEYHVREASITIVCFGHRPQLWVGGDQKS